MAAFNLEPTPDCFGISWNPKDVLCSGGADITYRDEKTLSHVRPPCDFFNACGARVSHAKMEQSRLVPVTNLVRSPTPQQPAAPVQQAQAQAPAQMTQQQMQQYLNEQARALAAQMMQQIQQYPQPNRGPAVPYNPAPYPQGNFMYDPRFQPMPVNYQMPGYLTVPETSGSILGMLARTLFRSMGKAAGHSFSHFWDTIPMGGPPSGFGGQGG